MSSSDDSRKRRRVQISESVAICHQATPLSDEERSESWWTATEFAQAKSTLKKECQKLRQARRYSDCLTDAYERACGFAQQCEATDDDGPTKTKSSEKEDSSGELPAHKSVDAGLLKLANNGPRGLESYSSKMHALRRHQHVQEAKHAVFLEQARQNLSNQRDAERLAEEAKQASSRARTFATMVGHADALVAKDTTYGNTDNEGMGAVANPDCDDNSEQCGLAECNDAAGASEEGNGNPPLHG